MGRISGSRATDLPRSQFETLSEWLDGKLSLRAEIQSSLTRPPPHFPEQNMLLLRHLVRKEITKTQINKFNIADAK
jgi:hypothetical protein